MMYCCALIDRIKSDIFSFLCAVLTTRMYRHASFVSLCLVFLRVRVVFTLVLKTYEHQLKGIIIEYNKSRALTNINIVGVGNYKARS